MEAFLAETGKGVEEETNKTFGKSLNFNPMLSGSFGIYTSPQCPKGEVLQTPASVIGSGLLGQGGGGVETRGTFGSLLGWAKGLKGNAMQRCRYRPLNENIQMPVGH